MSVKKIVVSALAFVIAGSVIMYIIVNKKSLTTDTSAQLQIQQSKDQLQPQKTYTTLIAAGDFIAHDALNAAAKSGDSYNYTPFIDQMKPIMQKASLKFCNQATLVGGANFGVSGYPSFNAPLPFIDAMQDVGCNIVNTASNHSSDKNQAAIDANVSAWEQKNLLAAAGQNNSAAQKAKVHYFLQDGVKYAFLAYTTYTNSPVPSAYGVNMYNRDFANSQIVEAKSNGAQFIIASMRWGTEYSPNANAYQKAEAQYLSDNGVALILGHGPHVLQPVQWLTGVTGQKTLVWYSLGNFLHAQLEPETLFNGVAVMNIDKKTATITSVGFLPTYMHYDWTQQQAAKQDLLARRNFELVPLENAAVLFAKSQLKTTIQTQKDRLQATLNTYMPISLITAAEL